MRLALITLLALAAVSCRAQTSTDDQKSSTATHAGPTIVLMGNSLTYNGKPLLFNTPIAAWQEVLGPSTKCDGDDGKTFTHLHCWNSLGLSASTDHKYPGQITTLHIFLNQRSKPDGYDIPNIGPDGKRTPRLNIYHSHLFTGRLELDGADVNSTSTVLDVIKQNDYSYNCLAELRDCWVGTDDPYYETGFSTDSRLQKGMIYEFEVSVRER